MLNSGQTNNQTRKKLANPSGKLSGWPSWREAMRNAKASAGDLLLGIAARV